MPTKTASTAAPNPLAESLAKVTGLDPLSESAGTANPITYDPDMAFRAPEGDTINITGDPGTGASQSETWSHDIALEQLKNQQLQFEYAQQQDLLEQAVQQQQYQLSLAESARAQEQLGLSKTQSSIQQAEAARAAALAPYQQESARAAAGAAALDLAQKQRQASYDQAYWNQANANSQRMMSTPGTVYSYGGASPWYAVTSSGQVTSNPSAGRISQQINPSTGQFYQNQSRAQLLGNNTGYY